MRLLTAFSFALAFSLAFVTSAEAAKKKIYDLDVLVNGDKLKEYRQDGKTYVMAVPGKKYKIRVRNRSDERVLCIMAIDGLSVINGKKPSLVKSKGYIIPPRDSITVAGWRSSYEKVRRFVFAEADESAAANRGKEKHVGKLGCGVVGEKEEEALLISSSSEMAESPSSTAKGYHSSVGTKRGARVTQAAKKREFVKDVEAGFSAKLMVYYASRQDLMEMGVLEDNDSFFGDDDFMSDDLQISQ